MFLEFVAKPSLCVNLAISFLLNNPRVFPWDWSEPLSVGAARGLVKFCADVANILYAIDEASGSICDYWLHPIMNSLISLEKFMDRLPRYFSTCWWFRDGVMVNQGARRQEHQGWIWFMALNGPSSNPLWCRRCKSRSLAFVGSRVSSAVRAPTSDLPNCHYSMSMYSEVVHWEIWSIDCWMTVWVWIENNYNDS